jgi:hypothetical protein
VKKLGSEQAAIEMLARDPSLMLFPKYDGLNPKFEKMLSAEELEATTIPARSGGVPNALLAAAALATLAAAFTANEFLVVHS